MDGVKGKLPIVTRGALSIGKASCILLAKEGAKVDVTNIRNKEGQR
jgi:NAD(P)-dependent dehydrogenase (short-subunit alcohol dehydrogenase family)